MRDRRLAVAAGAPGLLIIGLDRLGQAGMRDEADVGLVDAHAEGDRRDHHHVLARDEIMLVLRAHRRVEPGMIGADHTPLRRQGGGELLGGGAGLSIDDAGPGLFGDEVGKLLRRPLPGEMK
jgi:hypothetical protein